MKCEKFNTLESNERKHRQKILLDQRIRAYNQKLIDKGYNSQKRKELIKQFRQRSHINKIKSKRQGVFELPKNWNETQIAAYSPKLNTKNTLKLFYPEWDKWHHYLKMVPVPPQLSGMYVKDGHIWLNHIDIAKNLKTNHLSILETIKMILLNKIHFAENHVTYFKNIKIEERHYTLWLPLSELKTLQHSQLFNQNPLWIKLYQRIVILYNWLESHPWCQTIHGTTIQGQGELRNNLDVILSLEAMGEQHVTINGATISCSRGTYDKYNDLYGFDAIEYKKYPKQRVHFFEGRC